MDDLISRQAATDALHMDTSIIPFEKAREYADATISEIRNRLEKLPSAEPKTGKWILDRSGAYCCSECMEPCAGYVMMKPRDKFCKMCGTKMESTE